MWKIIVGIVTAAALTTVIVASCHDRRERARRDVAEPAYVETTGATAVGSGTEAQAAAEAEGAAPVAPVVTAPPAITVIPPTPTPAPGAAAATAPPSTNDSAGGIVGIPGSVVTAPRVSAPPAYPPGSAPRLAPPFPTATATPPPAATPTPDAATLSASPEGGTADASPRGAGSEPAPTTGAGRFITEAPYWGSSAFPTNPEAGAGPFRE